MKINGKSIRDRILISLVGILLVQSIVLFGFIVYGGVSQRLHSNAIDMLSENTENHRLQVEHQMLQHWMKDIQMSGSISQLIETVLEEEGKTAADIRTDSDLNREIVYEAMPFMIQNLHRSYGNGFYMILDGPAAPNSGTDVRAGVYIRDLDPSSYAEDNSDLLLERGLPSVSKEFEIPLDSYWELGFSLPEISESDYFYKPYNQVKDQRIKKKDSENYGYLGGLMRLHPMDINVITYSIPLTLSDGTTIGVIGGDITENQMRIFLKQGAAGTDMTIQMLGKRQAGSDRIEPIVTGNVMYDNYFGKQSPLELGRTDGSVSVTTDKNGDSWHVGVRKLDVYNHNTPFEQDEWVVALMRESNYMFSFYNQVRKTLVGMLLISIVVGMIVAVITGKIITNPIIRLIQELRIADRRKQIRLGKTRIGEVDELIDAIEVLSEDVAVAASRVSNVLEASGISLGVFEYLADTHQIFCSRSLFEILEIPCAEENYSYMDVEKFEDIMKTLLLPDENGDTCLYRFDHQGEKRWLRLKLVSEPTGNQVGVLTDVTSDVLERKKLERERDYDLLTNILNRRAFRSRVETLLKEERKTPMAFIMWDLDNLKYVNDTYGHEAGDNYIRSFADYLKTLEKAGAIVDRHSGDEFMAVLSNGSRKEQYDQIQDFMERMKQITVEQADSYRLPLRASAGITWYPEHALEYDTLVRYADFAMYMAKHNSKGILQEFSPDIYQNNSYLLSGNEELNHLLENGNVAYAFQPIVTREGNIYGYEALMRPQLVYLKNIEELIHLARTQAKLKQVEELTWMTAMECFERLDQQGYLEPSSRLFINSISSVQLGEECFLAFEKRFEKYLNRIVLEVTETEPKEECMQFKKEIMKKWDGQIAIDDYGSGYNSERLLLNLQPQIVKLDMDLVRNINMDKKRQDMLQTFIPFCHQQDIMIVAEGVETPEELETLIKMQVDLFQGFYLSRPEIELRPLNPFIKEKMKELSQK